MVTFMTFQGLPEYLCLSPALHHPLAFSDYLAEQVAPSPILPPLVGFGEESIQPLNLINGQIPDEVSPRSNNYGDH